MTNKGIIFFAVIIFAIKIASIFFTSFNLFGDEAQYWLWSKSLDFGYFSKPPFLAWFIKLHTVLFGENFVSLKLIPSLVYFLTAFALYNLCKNIGLNKNDSFVCSLIFLFIPAVSFSSFFLSTDLFLLLFWTLSLNELIKIKKSPDTNKFVVLGLMLGLAFLSKYAAIYFLLCLFLVLFLDKNFRFVISKNYFGLLMCIVCCFVVILPNLYWNLNNGWVTIQHTSDNANFNNIKINIFRGLSFLLTQIIMIGPLLFVGNVINYKRINLDSDKKFLLFFSIPIFLIVFIEAVIVRANANWAAPALISFYLFLYVNIVSIKSIYLKLNIYFNFAICIIFFILIGLSYPISVFERISGIKEFANSVKVYGDNKKITDYVVSDRMLFASLSYELKNYNLVLHMPHEKNDIVTNHFKISSPLKKEMSRNFILIGNINDIDYLENNFTCNEKGFELTNVHYQHFVPVKICFN